MGSVADLLSPEELAERLAALPDWAVVDGKLHREIVASGTSPRPSRS